MSDDDEGATLSAQERAFARQVRALREQRGMSQTELAKLVQQMGGGAMNQATISRIEKLGRPIRLVEAQALAAVFGRSIESMMDSDDEVYRTIAYIERAIHRGLKAVGDFKESVYLAVYAQQYAESFERGLMRLRHAPGGNDAVTNEQLDDLMRKVRAFRARDVLAELTEAYEQAASAQAREFEQGDWDGDGEVLAHG